MPDSGREVLNILIDQVSDRRVRAIVVRRYQGMTREIDFLAGRRTAAEGSDLALLFRRNWTLDRIRVLCALNAFYQEILGPLMSSSRKRPRTYPLAGLVISYGTTRFDEDRAKHIRSMEYDFFRKFGSFGANIHTMTAVTAGSLVYVLARLEREQDE